MKSFMFKHKKLKSADTFWGKVLDNFCSGLKLQTLVAKSPETAGKFAAALMKAEGV